MSEFKDRMKEARLSQNMTQEELAEKSGLHYSAISHFETGRREPSLNSLRIIVKALNVSADYLIGRDAPEPESELVPTPNSDGELIAKFLATGDVEEGFQSHLDGNPKDHDARIQFAEYLEKLGDTRAAGYRRLGEEKRVAIRESISQQSGRFFWMNTNCRKISAMTDDDAMAAAIIDDGICEVLRRWHSMKATSDWKIVWNTEYGWHGYYDSRREAEDQFALAFNELHKQES